MEAEIPTFNFEPLFVKGYDNLIKLLEPETQKLLWHYFLITKITLLILTILLSIFLGWLVLQVWKERRAEEKAWALVPEEPELIRDEVHEKWQLAWSKAESDNPSDWKIAIIEADNLLDEVITGLKYSGANLGERLKTVSKADLKSLDDAWEAHKVRNRIAHESNLFLTKKEVVDTLLRFERVFKELEIL